jgi:hypothetical protein
VNIGGHRAESLSESMLFQASMGDALPRHYSLFIEGEHNGEKARRAAGFRSTLPCRQPV